jgi:hypothetical protein
LVIFVVFDFVVVVVVVVDVVVVDSVFPMRDSSHRPFRMSSERREYPPSYRHQGSASVPHAGFQWSCRTTLVLVLLVPVDVDDDVVGYPCMSSNIAKWFGLGEILQGFLLLPLVPPPPAADPPPLVPEVSTLAASPTMMRLPRTRSISSSISRSDALLIVVPIPEFLPRWNATREDRST